MGLNALTLSRSTFGERLPLRPSTANQSRLLPPVDGEQMAKIDRIARVEYITLSRSNECYVCVANVLRAGAAAEFTDRPRHGVERGDETVTERVRELCLTGCPAPSLGERGTRNDNVHPILRGETERGPEHPVIPLECDESTGVEDDAAQRTRAGRCLRATTRSSAAVMAPCVCSQPSTARSRPSDRSFRLAASASQADVGSRPAALRTAAASSGSKEMANRATVIRRYYRGRGERSTLAVAHSCRNLAQEISAQRDEDRQKEGDCQDSEVGRIVGKRSESSEPGGVGMNIGKPGRVAVVVWCFLAFGCSSNVGDAPNRSSLKGDAAVTPGGSDAPPAQGAVALTVSPSVGQCPIPGSPITVPPDPAGEPNAVASALLCDLSNASCKPDAYVVVNGDGDAAVSCNVAPAANGSFDVNLSLATTRLSFAAAGTVAAAGGAVSVTVYEQSSDRTFRDPNCKLTVPNGASTVKKGALWAGFSCDALVDPQDSSGTVCKATGQFLFENCSGAG